MNSTSGLLDVGTLALSVAIAMALAVAVFAAVLRLRAQAADRKIQVISAAITEYFRKSDIKVTVTGLKAPDSERFVILIESEPMKQMRLSHIIETSLRDLMHNLHKIELDKIYWRFPIKQRPEGAQPGDDKKRGLDEYITEGLSYRHLPKAEVMESSWENFEKVSTGGPKPPAA
jgi:hypothetical protein